MSCGSKNGGVQHFDDIWTLCTVLSQADSLQLISVRWRKIENDLFKKKKQTFDLSKIADIYDCVV